MSKGTRVCGACYMLIRPGEYEPHTFIAGDCDLCGQSAFVHRVARSELDSYLADTRGLATSAEWFVREQAEQERVRQAALAARANAEESR